MDTALIAFFIATIAALVTTGLFFYALLMMLQRYRMYARLAELLHSLGLSRITKNPVLTSRYSWEQGGVMNPGAVLVGGRVHLFYRAVGEDGVSRIGYASSKDGKTFNERLPYPVLALGETPDPSHHLEVLQSRPDLVASGGSFAGTEDPRAVVIGDRVYLTFHAFSHWNSLRIAVTSISVDDLVQKRWNFTHPVYLSAIGDVQKNWVLFPEKIHGKFAVLHSLHAGERNRVLIDYVDSLDTEPSVPIESSYHPTTDTDVWDSTIRGAGPPPIKTDKGWLVLYHANDAKEPHRYKVGALLLDRADPTKVIARSPVPVLSPDAWYENNGAKSGIVYACGAVVYGDTLTVYYGGADSVVCAASNSLSRILRRLTPVS